MGFVELFLIAVGLSMDAFATAVGKGLSAGTLKPRFALLTGAYFGGFQALMPTVGFLLGVRFQTLIARVDHWIAFTLLALTGIHMLREAREPGGENVGTSFRAAVMLPLAIATSIDALAVGVSFAFLRVNILPAACLIGATTFMISCAGVCAGRILGAKYQSRAETLGGAVLLLMGLKILLEHLNLLA